MQQVHAVRSSEAQHLLGPTALRLLWLATHHIARNQVGSGVRVSWKIVPAVTDVWRPHAAHSKSRPIGHALPPPHFGQRNPSGHRSCTRYARHASAVAKRRSNSARVRG
jgi:hypothetical protein